MKPQIYLLFASYICSTSICRLLSGKSLDFPNRSIANYYISSFLSVKITVRTNEKVNKSISCWLLSIALVIKIHIWSTSHHVSHSWTLIMDLIRFKLVFRQQPSRESISSARTHSMVCSFVKVNDFTNLDRWIWYFPVVLKFNSYFGSAWTNFYLL